MIPKKCFMCDVETIDGLERSPLPKELLDRAPDGELSEDLRPICKKCNDFRKIVDSHFITLCEDARLWEWYRSNSKRRGEYYPPKFVFNISSEKLLELYYLMMDLCEEADIIASNNILRKELEDELNYEWRKKDD